MKSIALVLLMMVGVAPAAGAWVEGLCGGNDYSQHWTATGAAGNAISTEAECETSCRAYKTVNDDGASVIKCCIYWPTFAASSTDNGCYAIKYSTAYADTATIDTTSSSPSVIANKRYNLQSAGYGVGRSLLLDAPVGGGGAEGDPHVVQGDGDRLDFRGKHHTLYTFHSSANLTLNVMTELADFELHDQAHPRHKHVHGSFLTQAHVVARTNKGKVVRVSHVAENAGPTNMGFADGDVDGTPFKLIGVSNSSHEKDLVFDDVKLHMDYSSLHVTNGEFEIVATPISLHDTPWGLTPERNVQGLLHRFDVKIKLLVPVGQLKVAPHGIVSQGWDGDGLAIDGEQDVYPTSGEFTTSAMGKGAIEGTPEDYEVPSPFATDFKFSRFNKTVATPRDVATLVAAGVLNPPKKVKSGGDFTGATVRDANEL